MSFGFNIAVISMLVSALGDAAAALVGMRFGTHHMPFTEKKSLEGLFAGFSVTFIVAVPEPLGLSKISCLTVHEILNNIIKIIAKIILFFIVS